MNRLSSLPLLAWLAALLASCAPELDLPPPPDIQSKLDAFESPDAEVLGDIMAAVASRLLELHEEVDQSSFYEEIIDVVADVQEDLYDDDGQVDLGGGVSFPTPNGGVTIEYVCDGWDETPPATPDPDNGTIALNFRLAGGDIAPLVWGELVDCRYPIRIGDERLDGSADGVIAAYFGEPLPAGQNLKEVPEGEDPAFYRLSVIFVTIGVIAVDGPELELNDLFQVTFVFDDEGNFVPGATALTFLVELTDGTSFRYSFDADLTQRLEDGVGELTCSLEDRTCEGTSRAFSW